MKLLKEGCYWFFECSVMMPKLLITLNSRGIYWLLFRRELIIFNLSKLKSVSDNDVISSLVLLKIFFALIIISLNSGVSMDFTRVQWLAGRGDLSKTNSIKLSSVNKSFNVEEISFTRSVFFIRRAAKFIVLEILT